MPHVLSGQFCSLLRPLSQKRFLRLGQDHSETIACRELILDRILLGRAAVGDV